MFLRGKKFYCGVWFGWLKGVLMIRLGIDWCSMSLFDWLFGGDRFYSLRRIGQSIFNLNGRRST